MQMSACLPGKAASPGPDPPAPASAEAMKQRWTITAADEILLIPAVIGFPHLVPLNPKHAWPVTSQRLELLRREKLNPSALCVLGLIPFELPRFGTHLLFLLLIVEGTLGHAGVCTEKGGVLALSQLRAAVDLGCKTAAFNWSATYKGSARSRLQQAVGGPLVSGLLDLQPLALSPELMAWVKRAVEACDQYSMALVVSLKPIFSWLPPDSLCKLTSLVCS
jgi:hypothetical protein